MEKQHCLFLLFLGCLAIASCIPVDGDLVAVTTEGGVETSTGLKEDSKDVSGGVKITEMYIRSDVANRFAKTVVTSRVKNSAKVAKETTFWAILPEEAYIADFTMEIDGKNYTAYVEEKDKAKKTYDNAVASGQGAAHVALSARDSNKFTVTMNIEPESKAVFYLTYEELLKRNDEKYELILNINPKQIVNEMTVEVVIEENRKLTKVETPQMRTGNEIIKESEDLDPRATITRPSENKAVIVFKPNAEKQKQIARGLNKDEKEGIDGQFVVVYDVERDPSGGEVLVKDGYFVHFFAPDNQKPLKKHVVFVLDTSGSMYGQKIVQLRESLIKILGDAESQDYFNVVEFNTNVKVHNLNAPSESTTFPDNNNGWYNGNEVFDIDIVPFPPAYPVNADTKSKANKLVSEMQATGGTNIYEALRVGLHLIKLMANRVHDNKVQPIIFFLTDGDPTVGITNQNEITSKISELNLARVPIISLSFGQGADRNFLEKLSLNNFGFARHIYEDADASQQLENFYREVSNPLLRNVQFKYVEDATSLTKTEYPIYFKGSEFVVAGKIKDDKFYEIPRVECIGIVGPIILNTTVTTSVKQLERMWAYLKVKQILDAKKIDEKNAKEYDKQAIELSKKYSFVTPVTSLVVVKPNSTSAVDTSKADGSQDNFYGGPSFVAGAGGPLYSAVPQFSLASNVLPDADGDGIIVSDRLLLSSYKFSRKKTPAAFPGGYAFSRPLDQLESDVVEEAEIGYSGPQQHFSRPNLPITGLQNRNYYSQHFGGVASGGVFDVSLDYDVEDDEDSSFDFDASTVAATEPSTSTTTPAPVVLPDEYKPYLNWIEEFLRPDGSLKFLKGLYTLGFNETSPVNLTCTTLGSLSGKCKLVKDCPNLHSSLNDTLSFLYHFCSIDNKYAGVCCE